VNNSRARLYFLAMALLPFQATSYAGQFEPRVNYRVGSNPDSIAIGDFNGDGLPDVATANSGQPPGVGVVLGNGDGTFKPVVTYPAGKIPYAIVTADFNGDGKLDLAVVDVSLKVVNILLGNGDGSFQSPKTQHAGPSPAAIAVSDVNLDGKADLVVANYQGAPPLNGVVAVLLGNGDGSFQSPVPYAAGPSPNSVAAGDVNGDGFPDVVVGNSSSSLAILLGNGNGTFQQAKIYSGLGSAAHWVALGDFNNDGKIDVAAVLPAAGNRQNGQLVVGLGHGDGTFAPPALVGPARNLAASIAVADFTQDGFLDLVIAEGFTTIGKALIYMGNGNGTFQTPQQYPTAQTSVAVAAADLNGDGYPDLVVANLGNDSISVLINVGTGTDSRLH
jgi:hypothetical protein